MADEWISVEAPPPLREDEVQIWRIDLPRGNEATERYSQSLSEEERLRADRLRAGNVRMQFVVARACLRLLLGHIVGVAPKDVPITLSSFGKPETPGVFFNVAHSGDAVLIAMNRTHRIGIDVEHLNREVEALEIAKSSFSQKEYETLAAIGDADGQRKAFFRCWTRKEAIIKADGRGLSLPLDSFEVPVGEMAIDTPVVIAGDGGAAAGRYYLTDIRVGQNVASAYALPAISRGAGTFLFDLETVARKG